VLELSGLAEHVDERLAMLDDERRLRRGLTAARREHLREPPLAGDVRHGTSGITISSVCSGAGWWIAMATKPTLRRYARPRRVAIRILSRTRRVAHGLRETLS
jgi:hypothetical protein